MNSQVTTTVVELAPLTRAGRLSDYVQLVRPKIAVMVLVTAVLGMFLADRTPDAVSVALMLVGTGLVTAGASTFNQFVERRSDARMKRTASRPLPAGRLSLTEVVLFGLLTTVGGLVVLMFLKTGPAAAVVAGLTFVLYVFAYTPAKRRTWWNTFIGAVPGATPPLIGWAAACGTLGPESWPLFLILFFWQVPHFMAIAWIYRDEYRRAGLKMLPVIDPTGTRTSRTMIGHTLLLIAASLLPVAFGAGWVYIVGAASLGLAFLATGWRFRSDRTVTAARAVLRMSIVYLPGVLFVMFVDRLI
jgi:protoheme IX farnesyltransferase